MTLPAPSSHNRNWLQLNNASDRGCSRGFTLLELMALLLILSALAFTLFVKTQTLSNQQLALDIAHQMAEADSQLRQFAAQRGRLPCPDTGTDGIEDCGGGAAKGFLPYKTLGLATTQYRFGEIPMRYGVYRNATQDADLAVSTVRFNPTDMDGTSYATATADALDFCTGLKTAAATAASASYTYQQWPDATTANEAFVIGYAGTTDSDGANGLYDGLNGAPGPGFNAPGTPLSSDYDDTTLSRGFNELHDMMHCYITQRSLDLVSNTIAAEGDVIAMADGNKQAADLGVLLNAIGDAITAWGLLQSIAAIAGASEVLTISSSLLATAVATCVVLVGCALIPVYTTAVTFATVGLVASIAAAALTAAALGLQIAATVFYVGIAAATGPPPTGTPSTPYVPTPATQAQVNTAWDNLYASQVAATNALNAYNTAAANYATAVANTNAARAQLVTDVPPASALGTQLYPLIDGAGTKTVSTPAVVGSPTSSVTSSGSSICTSTTAIPPVTTCVPPLPYNQTSSSTPTYSGNCIGPIPGVSTTTNPGGVLSQPGCTTTKAYTDTQTTVTTTFTATANPNVNNASWSVTTTNTNYQSVTTVSAGYAEGALTPIDTYERLNAPYLVNGTLVNGQPPSSTAAYTNMNNAITYAEWMALTGLPYPIYLGGALCNTCYNDVVNYLTAYQNQQLLNYEVNGAAQVGTAPVYTWNAGTNSFDVTPASPDFQPAIPSPLASNRDQTAAGLENALDIYFTRVCSTGTTLLGQANGPVPADAPGAAPGVSPSNPGTAGTNYNSSTNMCVSGTGAGSTGTLLSPASGALNILNLLRSLGLVK